MAKNYGPGLVLAAGTVTFANEWLQTDQPNWRVVVATVLGAGIMSAIGMVSAIAANGLGAMVFIAALTTRFNGKSAAEEIASSLPKASSYVTGKG